MSTVTSIDVIRFGVTYVAQQPDCFPLVEAIIADAQRRRFRTRGGALSYTTRRLREAGLRVATLTDIRARRRRTQIIHGDFAA